MAVRNWLRWVRLRVAWALPWRIRFLADLIRGTTTSAMSGGDFRAGPVPGEQAAKHRQPPPQGQAARRFDLALAGA
jgi:hypothetical protein